MSRASLGTIRNVEELHSFSRSGTVIDREIRTETSFHATTTGGSSLLIDGVGTVSPPTTSVSSSTSEIVRMFLRDDSGDEFDVELEDAGMGFRTGHRVIILYAGDKRSGLGRPMAVANLTTDQTAVLPHRVEELIHRRSATLGCLALAVIPFFSMLLGNVLATILLGETPRGHIGTGLLFGFLALLLVGFRLLRGRQRNERLKHDIIEVLHNHLNREAARRW